MIKYRIYARDHLMKYIPGDIADVCIGYLLPRPKNSCSESCGTLQLELNVINHNYRSSKRNFHRSTCPDYPSSCIYCKNYMYHDVVCKRTGRLWLADECDLQIRKSDLIDAAKCVVDIVSGSAVQYAAGCIGGVIGGPIGIGVVLAGCAFGIAKGGRDLQKIVREVTH